MFCHKCGKELPDDANFCLKCGAPQQATSVSSSAGQAAMPRWEACEVQWQMLTSMKGLWLPRADIQFWADATGPNGFYCAGASRIISKAPVSTDRYNGTLPKQLTNPDLARNGLQDIYLSNDISIQRELEPVLREFIDALSREGWDIVPGERKPWWKYHLRRLIR